MPDPLDTLFELTDRLATLEMIQSWIDHARVGAPTNQHIQLELDRRQAEVNRKRALIAMLMADIRSRN